MRLASYCVFCSHFAMDKVSKRSSSASISEVMQVMLPIFLVRKTLREEYADSSSFGPLPDEVVLHILSKLINLKDLCLCKLVSTRFYRIVRQVDTISFRAPPIDLCRFDYRANLFQCKSYLSRIKSLMRFRGLKSLCIELPPSLKKVNTRSYFEAKINLGDIFDSFLFLSPDSIYDEKGVCVNENIHEEEEEEEEELMDSLTEFAMSCKTDAVLRCRMLFDYINRFPSLKNVSVTDTNSRARFSLSGEQIVEVRRWIRALPETIEERLINLGVHFLLSFYHVPLLELPVSGYVMKRVTLVFVEINGDLERSHSIVNIDWDASDDKEAAYSEAVMEIFKKHGKEKRFLLF